MIIGNRDMISSQLQRITERRKIKSAVDMIITYIMENVQLEMSQTNYFFVLTVFRVKRAEGEANKKWANTTDYLIPAFRGLHKSGSGYIRYYNRTIHSVASSTPCGVLILSYYVHLHNSVSIY